MSHVVRMELEVDNLDALFAAAQAIGLEVRLNQKTYKWFGRFMNDYPLPEGITQKELGTCDHALVVPGDPNAYQCGVKKKGGKYVLLYDFWGTHGMALERLMGHRGQKLAQSYSEVVAMKEIKKLQRQGYRLKRSVTSEGQIKLRLVR